MVDTPALGAGAPAGVRVRIPSLVRERVETFGRAVRETRPGLLDHLRVTGSSITGDWHESSSDIDLVVVVRRAVGIEDAEPLADLHRTAGRP